MKYVVLILLSGLLLSGCAKPPEEVYSHPKTGKKQLTAHIQECSELADKFGFINMSPVHQYPMDDMKDRVQRKRVFNFCMLKKGYERSGEVTVAVNEKTTRIIVADSDLAAGETSPVVISFASPVGGLDLADLTVENGRLSNLTSSDDGMTWSATLIPTENIDDTSNVIRLNNNGVINGLSNHGTGVTLSNNYAVSSQTQMLTAGR